MSELRRRGFTLLGGLVLVVATAGCMSSGPDTPTTTATAIATTTTTVGGVGSGRLPVIFVHGFGGSASSWTDVMREFTSQGYASDQLSAISYDSKVGIEISARMLEGEVTRVLARTGAPKVDIVSYSMGSMVAKTCIIIGSCKGKTARWNTISGVDNGSDNELPIARGTDSNEDVQGRTPLRKRLQDGWKDGIVAQGVKVQVHWSVNDGIVVPGSLSQQPPPARNIAKPNLDHLNIYSDAGVISEIVSFFAE